MTVMGFGNTTRGQQPTLRHLGAECLRRLAVAAVSAVLLSGLALLGGPASAHAFSRPRLPVEYLVSQFRVVDRDAGGWAVQFLHELVQARLR